MKIKAPFQISHQAIAAGRKHITVHHYRVFAFLLRRGFGYFNWQPDGFADLPVFELRKYRA